MRRAVRILVEAAEADEVVISEELDLLARFLHLDIFRRQRVDIKHLPGIHSHEVSETQNSRKEARRKPC